MKKVKGIFLSLFNLIFLSTSFFAQSSYDASQISPEMKKNANAVIRISETELDIQSPSSATFRVKMTVTVLNEKGRHLSIYYGYDDKFFTSHFGSLVIYNEQGNKVKNFNSSHLKPMITFTGSTLYDDVHLNYLDPEYCTYPFTAEISYNIDYKGTFSLPDWTVARDYNISTEKATMSVTAPADYKIRFLEQNIPSGPVQKKEKNKIIYQWEVANFKAIEKEPFSLPFDRKSPIVYFAPSVFELAGRAGNAENWKDFGLFLTKLNEGRNVLPEEVQAKIRDLAAAIPDTTELVKKLYALMQEKTRYVSVQIGIGGWQPIEAMKVEETSYGDCKALSNYMKSLLDVAGIKSHYAVIYAGDNETDIIASFPSNQFNHAILCVPSKKDTIWLECTSQRIPFNYIGSFTDDRNALLITADGGKLVRTKRYTADENMMVRKANVSIEPTGNGKATVKTTYSSWFYDEMIPVLLSDNEDQKKMIIESLKIPGFSLVSYNICQPDKSVPVIKEDIELTLKNYASIMSDRLLLPLNTINRTEKLPVFESRKSDILIRRDKMMIDTIEYQIPNGYKISSSLNPVSYDTQFGSYSISFQSDGNKLIYIRHQKIKRGLSPSSDYPAFNDYMNKISAADKAQVVLRKETSGK